MENGVDWAHMLDPALELKLKPITVGLWKSVRRDRHSFFMETLARTLDYEQNLRDWRIAELKDGRSDPGRPKYEEASTGSIRCVSCLTRSPGIW